MLYDSTKGLLQSILASLETGDGTRWDDQNESGNACLYEMHQMSGPLYRAYRSDSPNANLPGQSSLPEKLNRAMPHVRLMVIAIRHRDRTGAIERGKAALVEMNRTSPSLPIGRCAESRTESRRPMSRQQGNPATGRQRSLVQDGRSSRRTSE